MSFKNSRLSLLSSSWPLYPFEGHWEAAHMIVNYLLNDIGVFIACDIYSVRHVVTLCVV